MPPKRQAATRASARLQKKDTRRSKRAAEEEEEDSEEFSEEESEEEEEVKPKRRSARRKAAPRKRKQASSEEDDDDDEEEEEEEAPAKRPRLTRKAKEAKAPSEDEDEDDEDEDGEEDGDEKTGGKPGKGASAGLAWQTVDTMLILDGSDIKPSAKIASFDMDDTLINPKSGRSFPTGRTDWKWWNAKVPAKLKELHEDGYKLVIFTNQAGITKGKTTAKDIQGKILDIIAELGLPLQAFVATTEDKWRKPSPSMWRYFAKNHNGGIEVDLTQSFYCGDAAGRAKAWDGNAKTKKDHSCSDRKFARNLDLPFKTPEMLFFGHEDVEFQWGSIDPSTIPKSGKPFEGEVTSDSQEMILCVGFPALTETTHQSGKSTFSKRYLVPKGYVHVNQDTMHSKAGCLKAARAAVAEGKSVVIDNTNPSASVRAEYIAIAQDQEIPVRCFVFKTPLELAQHMNSYRQNVFGVKHVPGVGYNMYKKNFKQPNVSEGFTEIKEINFVPHFDDPEKEKRFYHFT